MLNLVQQPPPDPFTEARELLDFIEVGRPLMWALGLAVLVPMIVLLLATGHVWAWFFIGAAMALALGRYGPPWWPGRR